MGRTIPHTPVLAQEVLAALPLHDADLILDCTFGAGGHTRKILESGNCCVSAIDQDPTAYNFVQILKDDFPGRLTFTQANFADATSDMLITHAGKVGAILFDLGVSSMQLDTKERGFSFNKDAHLSMRMDSSTTLPDASDFVNTASQDEIENILYGYSDEHKSRQIAAAIIKARKLARIDTTLELTKVIHEAIGPRNGRIDSATKTFQAIRIHVNQEIDSLIRALGNSVSLLEPGGVVCVITFHSVEDRVVKKFFRAMATRSAEEFENLASFDFSSSTFEADSTIKPHYKEIEVNPRSRSAILRILRRKS